MQDHHISHDMDLEHVAKVHWRRRLHLHRPRVPRYVAFLPTNSLARVHKLLLNVSLFCDDFVLRHTELEGGHEKIIGRFETQSGKAHLGHEPQLIHAEASGQVRNSKPKWVYDVYVYILYVFDKAPAIVGPVGPTKSWSFDFQKPQTCSVWSWRVMKELREFNHERGPESKSNSEYGFYAWHRRFQYQQLRSAV